ncbi:MAG: DUF3000 domain-containing protein [Flaviflexus sp.]|uniref:DUF3000 domain-containing protein n=1 Tax=Flaviflexus ciconiae TaxID=2496867 RepID=A0A3Q9G2V9_9ACTO|nr:DUF3000 domain-containing protein [Flaviflexus ciconiae]AZQ76444.1 DUF3000 domain-containing protein [Flaviflexus ciconiae]
MPDVPPLFLASLDSLRDHTFRREFRLQEIPAPKKIAPWAAALAAEVNTSGDALDPDGYRAEARFVLLHDPAGQPAWDSTFRIVCHVSAPVEAELGDDPLLGEVAWSWLTEALEAHGAPYHSLNGTVTRQIDESFRGLHLDGTRVTVEVRASWSPASENVADHLDAWAEFACTAGGLDPDTPSITPLDRL